ncbi:hypothetical protein MLD38_027148 [Melastoma candidum]|uniref:Uncharacterized protein n=1 Tax=Melastoma candidum TaxID=119954 RepID=A0ACB9P258_9MYRT|nr:hypothetical protein MLD38_027148 [Melastoma candidum]
MDPNPNSHPILSYVMSRLPSIGSRFTPPASASAMAAFDIEQPAAPSPSPLTSVHVSDPNLFSSMANAVTTVYQTRSILQTLGPRPDHESIDLARSKLSEIDADLSKKLEETALLSRPPHIDRNEWRVHLAERESELRKAAEREKRQWKATIDLDELHRVYEGMVKEAEEKLVKLYEGRGGEEDGNETDDEVVEVSEDVIGVLQKGAMERVQLNGRSLRVLPDAFGSIKGLLYLDVSNNQLAVINLSPIGFVSSRHYSSITVHTYAWRLLFE